MQFKIPPKDSIELPDNSKIQRPAIVVKGFNKGRPMTQSEIEKRLRDTKSRLKAIESGSKDHGTKERAAANIQKFEAALQKFNQ